MSETPPAPDKLKEAEPSPWSLGHPRAHGALCAVVAGAVGILVWWIAAETATPDGSDVWWRWWQVIGVVASASAAAVGGWCIATVSRKRRARSASRAQQELSLRALVAGGFVAAVVIGFGLAYGQAELVTPPGEAVASLHSGELLDIVRSTALGLGALSAIAVLLVNYRKQKSTEATLILDRRRHDDTLLQAREDLALEREKHQASEIAALHDRYTKAVEQLADKQKPTIRLGGVHAIAALGDDWYARGNHTQRQVCVDLLCSYLRSAPQIKMTSAGKVLESELDLDYLQDDRDVLRAALEWLSRIATDQAEESTLDGVGSTPTATIDLQGVQLEGLDLSHAKFSHLPLENANLKSARLMHADLTCANLLRATLTCANLVNARLTGANIQADLYGADLTNAMMAGANLSGAEIQHAQFLSADLAKANLAGAQVDRHTLFIGANLYRADFTGVNARVLSRDGVDFSKAVGVQLGTAQSVDQDNQQDPTGGSDEAGLPTG